MAISIGIIEATLRLRDEMSRDVAKAQQTLSGLGTAARTAGLTMTAGLTVPIAALGTSALRAAIDFEDSFTGVLKTVDDATDSMGQLNDVGIELTRNIREMSRELPFTSRELNGIGEAAGQLGIRTENIAEFTRVMASLGATTNLAADDAARALARLANITGLQQDEFSNLGSAVVDLGNNFATTEGELVTFALRIAASGRLAGLTQGEILGLGTAMSAVGVQAEAGGTAVQKVLTAMIKAVAQGGAELNTFAQTAGTSAEDFASKFQVDAAGAFQDFVNGLRTSGDEAFNILDDLGLGNERVIRAFLSLANAGDLVVDAMDLGARAFEENTALAIEAEKRFRTFAAQIQVLKNTVADIAVSFGNALLPMLQRTINAIRDNVLPAIESMVRAFQELSPGIQAGIVAFTGILAVAGPVVAILGLIVAGVGAALPVFAAMGISLGGAATAVTLLTGSIAGAGGLIASFLAAEDGAENVASGITRIEGPLRNTARASEDVSTALGTTNESIDMLVDEIGEVPTVASSAISEIDRLAINVVQLGDSFLDAGKAVITFADSVLNSGLGQVVVDDISNMTTGVGSLFNSFLEVVRTAELEIKLVMAQIVDDTRGNTREIDILLGGPIDKAKEGLSELGGAVEVATGPWKAYNESLRGAQQITAGMIPGVRNLQGELENASRVVVELTEDQQGLMDAISGSDLQAEVDDLTAVFGALASQGTLTADAAMRVAEAAASLKEEGAELNPELAFMVRHFQNLEIVLNRLPRQLTLAEALDGLNRAFEDTQGAVSLLPDGILPSEPITNTTLGVFGLAGAVDMAGDAIGRFNAQTLNLDFFSGIRGGFSNLMEGLTGGKGFGGFMNNLGAGIVQGFGNMISQGLSGALQMGVELIGKAIMSIGRSTEDNVRIVGDEMGLTLSDAMVERFAAQVDSGEFRSEWAAVMGNLAAVIEESGGVGEVGIETSIRLTRDLFSFVEMGQLTIEQAGDAFREVFGELLPAVLADGSQSVNDAFAELLNVARDFAQRMGVDITEALGMLSSEFDKVFNDLIARAVDEGFDSVEDEFNRAIELAQQFGVDLSGSIAGFQEQLDNLNLEKLELLKEVAQDGAASLETFIESGIGGAVGIQAASAAALALFNSMIESGASFSEALATITPALNAMSEQLEELGLEAPDALKPFIEAAGLLSDELTGPVVKGAIAAGEVLKALEITGGLTNQTFAQFGASIKSSFNQLLESGATSETALMALRGPLSTLIFLQETYGFKVDDGTQKLIDQAKEAGITGEESKTAAEKQLDALDKVIEALEELIRLFRDEVGDAAEQAGRDIEGALPDEIEVDVVFDVDAPNISIDESGEVTAFARGGIVNKPVIGLIGEEGPEAVIPLNGGNLEAFMTDGGGGGSVDVYIDARGALIGDYNSQRQLAQLVSDAIVNDAELERKLGV